MEEKQANMQEKEVNKELNDIRLNLHVAGVAS
jgi:hypothetical protein